MGHKSSPKDVQERVHLVSLMLRRKSVSHIVKYCERVWGIGRGGAYCYIRAAKAEWQIYFNNLKANGKAYHVTQLRDLKDQAFSIKKIIGEGEDIKIVRTPNLPLVLEIAKEEAKLMGVYPIEKHEVNFKTNFAQWVKEVKKRKELSKEDFKVQSRNDGKVLEGVIVPDEQMEEGEEDFKEQNRISRAVPEVVVAQSKQTRNGEKEEEQMDLTG